MEKKELIAKAKELGIEIIDDMSEDNIKEEITKKEELIQKENEGNIDYLREESKKAFKARDDAKADVKTLKAKLKKIEDETKNKVDPNVVIELKDQLKVLEEFKKEAEEKAEELRLKDMNEVDRQKARAEKAERESDERAAQAVKDAEDRFQKQIDDLSDKLNLSLGQTASLRESQLKSDIIISASKYNAISPSHIYKMLRNEFEYDADVGKFTHVEKDLKGKFVSETELDDFVSNFLNDKSNDYLVKSNANTNSLDTQSTVKKSNSTNIKGSNYDPKDPELIKKAKFEGFATVEGYIRTLIIRDEKLKKVKGKTEQ